MAILRDEVEVLTSRLEPHDTGHIHTTISTLNNSIEELDDFWTWIKTFERNGIDPFFKRCYIFYEMCGCRATEPWLGELYGDWLYIDASKSNIFKG